MTGSEKENSYVRARNTGAGNIEKYLYHSEFRQYESY